MPGLTDLPNELLLLIIWFVGGDERSLENTYVLNNYIFASTERFEALVGARGAAVKALNHLSRTSRRLHALAIPEMYRHICLVRRTRKRKPLFRRFFASPISVSALANTRIISYFSCFDINPKITNKEREEKDAYDICRLFALPNLQILTIYNYSNLGGFRPLLDNASEHGRPVLEVPLSSVTTIRLHESSAEIGEDAFKNLFERLRALKHLSFEIKFDDFAHHAWDARILVRALHNQRTSLETLNLTLRFSYSDPLNFAPGPRI